jgi:ribosomal protein S18 acetylase RimI-like enzyme
LEAVLADARRREFLRVELHVWASNAPAIALYQRCGFQTEGVLVNHVRVDGCVDNTLSMAILLK